MKKILLIILFLLFAFGQIKGQETLDDFKIQYDSLIAAGNKRSALIMAQKMNEWALRNEGDTSYAYSISSWYIAQNIGNMDSSLQYAFESLKYFQLKSWDSMMLPKFFSKILVVVGQPLILSGNEQKDKILLENTLNSLTDQAQTLLKSA